MATSKYVHLGHHPRFRIGLVEITQTGVLLHECLAEVEHLRMIAFGARVGMNFVKASGRFSFSLFFASPSRFVELRFPCSVFSILLKRHAYLERPARRSDEAGKLTLIQVVVAVS